MVLHKVQQQRCREMAGLASLPCFIGTPPSPTKHETPSGIASAAVAWKWAFSAHSMAQSSADWGAETTGMQNMCRAWPFWSELFLGTHVMYMQTIPNLAELSLHVCLKSEVVQARYARRQKRRGHAQTAVSLDNLTAMLHCTAWPRTCIHLSSCISRMRHASKGYDRLASVKISGQSQGESSSSWPKHE